MSAHANSRRCILVLAVVVAGIVAAPAVGALGEEDKQWRRAEGRASAAAPSEGARAARAALRAVGVRYRWGGESPSTGFDCSGLVRWAYGHVGIDLPHSSYALYDVGRRVDESRLAPGDLLFFEGLGHVGLYVGRGRMVHAPQSGRRVEVVRLARSGYGLRLTGVRRITPE